jgi:hypothetical protein
LIHNRVSTRTVIETRADLHPQLTQI